MASKQTTSVGRGGTSDGTVSTLVSEFRTRGLVPDAVSEDVAAAVDAGEFDEALWLILRARWRERDE